MRFAIFGDIHGNLEALEAVLRDAEGQSVDEYLCLGDIVGYGADPDLCVQRVRELGCLTVVGNHDHACTGHLDISYFNQYARAAAQWTEDALSAESIRWLESRSFVEHAETFVLVHGSLQAPEAYNYIQTVRDAEYTFRSMDKPLCFCGHSHVPLSFFATDPVTYTLDETIPVDRETRAIVNVGSVGQPRDERPQAAYGIFDAEAGAVTIRRVEYDIEAAAGKITDAGLPQPLALRLWLGK
jgi:diadenosine tetraphosphatase ApaH/serine/threonine PP2A family protein phosphatase